MAMTMRMTMVVTLFITIITMRRMLLLKTMGMRIIMMMMPLVLVMMVARMAMSSLSSDGATHTSVVECCSKSCPAACARLKQTQTCTQVDINNVCLGGSESETQSFQASMGLASLCT